jgi:hypothetical protein
LEGQASEPSGWNCLAQQIANQFHLLSLTRDLAIRVRVSCFRRYIGTPWTCQELKASVQTSNKHHRSNNKKTSGTKLPQDFIHPHQTETPFTMKYSIPDLTGKVIMVTGGRQSPDAVALPVKLTFHR